MTWLHNQRNFSPLIITYILRNDHDSKSGGVQHTDSLIVQQLANIFKILLPRYCVRFIVLLMLMTHTTHPSNHTKLNKKYCNKCWQTITHTHICSGCCTNWLLCNSTCNWSHSPCWKHSTCSIRLWWNIPSCQLTCHYLTTICYYWAHNYKTFHIQIHLTQN